MVVGATSSDGFLMFLMHSRRKRDNGSNDVISGHVTV